MNGRLIRLPTSNENFNNEITSFDASSGRGRGRGTRGRGAQKFRNRTLINNPKGRGSGSNGRINNIPEEQQGEEEFGGYLGIESMVQSPIQSFGGAKSAANVSPFGNPGVKRPNPLSISKLSAANQNAAASIFRPSIPIAPVAAPTVLNDSVQKNAWKAKPQSSAVQKFQVIRFSAPLPQHHFPIDQDPQPQQNLFTELAKGRDNLRRDYIKAGKMSAGAHSLKDAITFVGECLDMCPEYERYEREAHNGLDPLEKIPGTDAVDHVRAVKRYKRSAAGDPEQMPSDVRPPQVLLETLSYLIYDLLGVYGFEKTYTFLRDRQRSIRSDFQLQNYRGAEAVRAFEVMVRYGILAQHRVAVDPESRTHRLKQEIDQLNAALKTLMEMYSELGGKGIYFPNEPEFRAYFILIHIWAPEVVVQIEKDTRPDVFFHPMVQRAIEIQSTVGYRPRPATGFISEYAKFFKLVQKPDTTYLMAAVCETHFVVVRMKALKAAFASYYTFEDENTMISGNELVRLLGFDDIEEVLEYSQFLNIPHVEIDGEVKLQFGKIVVDKKITNQGARLADFESFNMMQRQRLNRRIVESKLAVLGLHDVEVIEGKDRQPYVFDVKSEESNPRIFAPRPITRKLSESLAMPLESLQRNQIPGTATTFNQQKQSISASLGQLPQEKSNYIPAVTKPSVSVSCETTRESLQTYSSFNFAVNNPVSSSLSSLPTPIQSLVPQITFKPQPSVAITNSILNLQTLESNLSSSNQFISLSVPTLPTKTKQISNNQFESPFIQVSSSESDMDDELIATDILVTLLDSHVRQSIREIHHSLVFEAHEMLLVAESESLLESIFQETVSEMCDETLYNIRMEREFDTTLSELSVSIAESIVNEVVEEFINFEIIFLDWEVYEKDKWIQKWRKSLELRNLKKQAALECKKREFLHVIRHMEAAPPLGPWKGKLRDRRDEDEEWKVWELVQQRQNRLFSKIGVEECLINAGIKGVWKCAVSCGPPIQGGMTSLMRRWIKNVLRMEDQEEVVPDADRSDVNHVTVWGMRKQQINKKGGRAILGTKTVDVVALICGIEVVENPQYPLKRNYECLCSGVSSAIFVLDVFEGASFQKKEFWAAQRNRLYSFLSTFPAHANVPLLLLFNASVQLDSDEFYAEVSAQLNFKSIIEDGPVSTVSAVEINFEVLDDQIAEQNIYETRRMTREKLEWLISESYKEPVLKTGIIKDLIETKAAKNLAFAIRRISDCFPSGSIVSVPSLHQNALNAIIRVFNIHLEAASAVISHSNLQLLPWPAKEYPYTQQNSDLISVSMDWNSPLTLSERASAVDSLKLPEIPESPQGDDILSAYMYWISSLRGSVASMRTKWISESVIDTLKGAILKSMKVYESRKAEDVRFPIRSLLEEIIFPLLTSFLTYFGASADEIASSFYLPKHVEVASDAIIDAVLVEATKFENTVFEINLPAAMVLKSKRKALNSESRGISPKRSKLIADELSSYNQAEPNPTDPFDDDDVVSYVSEEPELLVDDIYSKSSDKIKTLAKSLRELIKSAKEDLANHMLQ